METGIVLSAGAIAALLLEGLKLVWRLWVVKLPTYDFPVKFYMFMLPVLTFVVQPLMALLFVGSYQLPTDWVEWLRQLVIVVLASLVALITYKTGIKPMKDYRREVA